jgi:mRNA-degrading endonuclease toxin of MazEF toxin-antitoxin module
VLAHQITTVDRSKLMEPRLGRLSEARLAELDRSLRNYLDLTEGA